MMNARRTTVFQKAMRPYESVKEELSQVRGELGRAREELSQAKAAIPDPAELQAQGEQLTQVKGELILLLPLPSPPLAPQLADSCLCAAKASELEGTLKERDT